MPIAFIDWSIDATIGWCHVENDLDGAVTNGGTLDHISVVSIHKRSRRRFFQNEQ